MQAYKPRLTNPTHTMSNEQIKNHCTTRLKMTPAQAQIVVDNLYTLALPDFSEMSWRELNQIFRDVLYCATHPNPLMK